MKPLALCVGLMLFSVGPSAQTAGDKHHGLITPSDVAWGAAPASLPAGAQAALLEGDPAKEGPFTLRLRLPAGYRLPPHFHPAVEHVTVLQGTFVLGMGETVNSGTEKPLGVGSFAFMPAGTRHFARAEGDTIIQLHGTGPWGISYVNPSDDPRKKQD